MTEQEIVNADNGLFYISIFVLTLVGTYILVKSIIRTFTECNQTRHRMSETERISRNYTEKR